MTNLNTIMEISNLCHQRNIELKIDHSGIVLSAYRNKNVYTRRYELTDITNVIKDLPLEVIVDLFIEDAVLQFGKIAY